MGDFISHRFGNYTVLGTEVTSGHTLKHKRKRKWECVCDCGNIMFVNVTKLFNGNDGNKHCGCMRVSKSPQPIDRLEETYRLGAESRGYEYALPQSTFRDLVARDCHYCGTHPGTVVRGRGTQEDLLYNGIDRVDNSIGYAVENCVTCCFKCNKAKGVMGGDEFLAWVEDVYFHRIG